MAAIAAAAAIAAGTSIASAKMASNSAKNAAKIQAQSGREANTLAGSIYGQQQRMQSPYMAIGQNAAMTLGRLMGAPQGSRYAAPPVDLNGWGAMMGLPQAPVGMAPGSSGVRPIASAANPNPWGAFLPPAGGY